MQPKYADSLFLYEVNQLDQSRLGQMNQYHSQLYHSLFLLEVNKRQLQLKAFNK